MILYLDASALVKRYIVEAGSQEVNQWIADANAVGTSILTRTEVSAAIARAQRMDILSREEAQSVLSLFRSEWEYLQRLPVTETITISGDFLAWENALRGYDAIHLACALSWQEILGLRISLVTFDNQLWGAGKNVGLSILPEIAP